MLFNLLTGNGGNGSGGGDWTSYLMIGVLLVAIIGLFIWSSNSNKKKQKEAQKQIEDLKRIEMIYIFPKKFAFSQSMAINNC